MSADAAHCAEAHGRARDRRASRARVRRRRRSSTPARTLGIDTPTLCYGETLRARQRLPRLRRRGRGPARARAGLLPQGRAGMVVKTDSERVRLTPQAGARAARLLGRPVDRAERPRLPRALRRASPSATARRRRRIADRDRKRTGHHAEPDGQTAATVARAGEGRQRALRPRLLEVHPLLQVRRRLRRAVPEHVRHRRRRPRLRRAHLDRVRGRAARVGLRLLRQLHRCLPDRRADLQERVRHARRRQPGTSRADRDRDDLPVLRRRLQPRRCTSRTTTIVKVTSPDDHDITRGNLCIKGRFGFQHVQARGS